MPRQRIAITGASGFIGGALTAYLSARGDQVVRLVRRPARSADEISWDPAEGRLDPAALADVDAVVHLAGAGVGDHRWTPAYKDLVLRSRIDGTRTVASALAAAIATTGRPIRLVSASAVGFYGDRGDEILTEASGPGTGFLAQVVGAWEGATEAAVRAGSPVAFARSGLVMGPHGGAFARMLTLGRLGLGGPLGSGRQYWPWVTLPDTVRAFAFLLDHPHVVGPVNVVGPDPRPQREVARALGAALGRPTVLPAPAFALRIVLGEFADDVLASQRVQPGVLTEAGFAHEHATLAEAVGWLVSS
jgi:uncharacterized protein (TIGR01777 family)